MKQSIGQLSLLVRDYDEAIHFYVHQLGFTLVEDTAMPAQNKRWVVVAPPGSEGLRLLLARAVGDEQASRVGNQTQARTLWNRCRVPGRVQQSVGFDSSQRLNPFWVRWMTRFGPYCAYVR
nr:VOC family protein [Rhodoferax sp.]